MTDQISHNLATEIWKLMQVGDICPCCNGIVVEFSGYEPPNYGHSPMVVRYTCPEHGDWYEQWCSACDSECPKCGCELEAADYEYVSLADLSPHEREKLGNRKIFLDFPQAEEQASSQESQTKERILQARHTAEHLFSD